MGDRSKNMKMPGRDWHTVGMTDSRPSTAALCLLMASLQADAEHECGSACRPKDAE